MSQDHTPARNWKVSIRHEGRRAPLTVGYYLTEEDADFKKHLLEMDPKFKPATMTVEITWEQVLRVTKKFNPLWL